jgi:hypothetical protein
MSAFGGKADITEPAECLLLTLSGPLSRHERLVALRFRGDNPVGASARFVMLQPISVEGDELARPLGFIREAPPCASRRRSGGRGLPAAGTTSSGRRCTAAILRNNQANLKGKFSGP